MLFFLLINVKMPTIVGILTFMSMKNFMLNELSMKKSFITSGPDLFGKRINLICIPKEHKKYDQKEELTKQMCNPACTATQFDQCPFLCCLLHHCACINNFLNNLSNF